MFLTIFLQTKFILVKDGSGFGAAYVAAVADRMEKQGIIEIHPHKNNTGRPHPWKVLTNEAVTFMLLKQIFW